MTIFVNSYAYIYERHFRLFDYFQNKKDLVFILPKVWKAKGGKISITPPERNDLRIIAAKAPFYHSHYPILRGMLKGWIPSTGKILKKLAKEGDILLSSAEPNLLTTYLYSRLAKKLGLKHVFLTWQNIPYPQRLRGLKLKLTEWLLRQNINLSAGALCGTNQAYQVLKPYLNSKIKVDIIPQSGVDTDLFKPAIPSDFRKNYGLEGKLIFLFGAVFDERKGVFTTISAFNDVFKQIPSTHLVMIGMGKLWPDAKKLVEELGLIKAVTFIDWMPNEKLPSVFASVDVLVHPSEPYKDWEEQYGWTMLQASLSGLPVVATNIGAIGEAVLNGKTGLLVEPKNPEALAKAMIYLASNPSIRKKIGEEGRQHILKKYSHKVIAEHLENFIQTL